LGIPLSLKKTAEWDESFAFLSISRVFFELVGIFRLRVLLPFFAALRWQLAEEKETLDVMPNKFEFHSREAWMEFKLAEDT